jgi:hypothetical protein
MRGSGGHRQGRPTTTTTTTTACDVTQGKTRRGEKPVQQKVKKSKKKTEKCF